MIYFDNGATTEVCSAAREAVLRALDSFGNPSSSHNLGINAKSRMKACADKIEAILNAERDSFFFTSGATEANNWAVFGAAGQQRGKTPKRIITTKTEHPSVLEPFFELESRGFDVVYVGVSKDGTLNMDELFESISENTVLVSVMHVNNETGNVNDVKEIGRKIKQINENVLFHVDGVCAFGKLSVNVKASKIDLFSLSGHKIHAPKGIGGLYVRKGVKISPLILGGGQQGNMRSGTESTVLIESLAVAAEACAAEMTESREKVAKVKRRLRNGFLEFGGVEINGDIEKSSSPYVLNVGFRGIKAQTLVNALEEKGIFVSTGSACKSNAVSKKTKAMSPLSAMGLDDELLEGSVRFSFSKYNNEEEADICVGALKEILGKYRNTQRSV